MEINELSLKINQIEETLELLMFRQDLIFSNTPIDRIIFEYNINKNQYNLIMDLMDKYREKIQNAEDVNRIQFEGEMYEIVSQHRGNYHFVETLTRAFWESNRWEEVFETLYRSLPKYKINKKDS